MAVQQLKAVAGPCLDLAAKSLGKAVERAVGLFTVTLPNPDAEYFYSNGTRIEDAATKAIAIQRETINRYQARASNVLKAVGALATVLCLPFSDSKVRTVIAVIGVSVIFKGQQIAQEKINAHYRKKISSLDRQIRT